MEFDESTFDGAYALESTLHARDPEQVYREILRVLKPGAIFFDSAWAMTDAYDPQNPEHVKIKEDIEVMCCTKKWHMINGYCHTRGSIPRWSRCLW